MQKYIDQLIEDLNQAAQDPPNLPYIEIPEQGKEQEEIGELATSPYKTIEDLTGIDQDSFPPVIRLDADQCKQVNKAIFNVYDALRLQAIDIPPNYPEEQLYDVLTSHWQFLVQYLPSSGMDLEFCTGAKDTCPYGEFCDCGQPFDEIEIPHRFHKLIPGIAESIDAGFVCFLNEETLEVEEVPKALLDDPLDFERTTGFGMGDHQMKHENWCSYFKFEPLESHDSFKIMEAFAEYLEDENFQDTLFHVLSHKRPFANFKWKIDNSPYRQDWFDFKQEWLEDHIKRTLHYGSNELKKTEPEGFFDDDGRIVDPETVPISSLCILCKKHRTNNQEENIFCLMTRFDQRNSEDFRCDAFEKI